ncbi:MutS protein msh4 [Coemansia sp. BCRC 34301]|nr:MutS protein msh4 [Coemansia sp. BCRC 34301]
MTVALHNTNQPPQCVTVGRNVDTVVGVVSTLVSSPVCALLVAANALMRGSLSSPWMAAYAAVFAARFGSSWLERRRRAAAGPVDWANQVVLVTGGSHGIGLALVRRLAATEARIAVVSIAPMAGPVPPNVIEYLCDLADAEALEQAVDKVERDLGSVTMLINNAGTVCPLLVSEQSAKDIERVARVNFVAPMLLTRRVLPGMLASNGNSHVVFVSSVLAFMGVPQLATYTASKAGLTLFHESLSLELRHRLDAADRVRTTVVFPSKVASGMFAGLELPQWLSPELSPELVADVIFCSLRDRTGGEICLPVFATLAPLYLAIDDDDLDYSAKRPKLKYGDSASTVSELAPTSAYSVLSSAPNTLMVLTEGRAAASEIAYCFFDLSTTHCTLSQFADGPSYSHTIYAVIACRPQIVLVPRSMSEGKSKAMVAIRRYLPWLAIAPLERRLFNDMEGMQLLHAVATPAQTARLALVLDSKRYAYAAFNALFHYLEHTVNATFARGGVSVSYRQMEGTMQIDPGAWHDLGLDSSTSNADVSLFAAINHTQTKMGARLLHASILQPSTDLNTIYARQSAVLEILDNEETFFFLSANLAPIPDIDAAITSLVRMPVATTAKQVGLAISNVLNFKHILQLAKAIAAGMPFEPQCCLLQEIVGVLMDSRSAELLAHIHSVIREGLTFEKSAQMTRSQRCHAVKDGVNGFLDMSRAIFDRVTQEVVELVEQYSNETQLPIKATYKPSIGYIMSAKREVLGNTIPEEFVNVVVKKTMVTFSTIELIKLNNRLASVVTEINLLTEKAIHDVADVIRQNVAVLYRVSEAIALLDMLVSFAHHCTVSESVVPAFSDSINIVDGRHPILEAMGSQVVANNVATTNATFTVVSGPNMGGKSTYLRQIVYFVIMAQIGSLVPAKSATLKIFDKLFVQMSNGSEATGGGSTFQREMHGVAYILHNYNAHSLVVIDELGRSTAAVEGMSICRAVCEHLLESSATVFLSTHYLGLPPVLGVHQNCACIVMSESNDTMLFKATADAQAEPLYGIRLAERMGFPEDIIRIARAVASDIGKG